MSISGADLIKLTSGDQTVIPTLNVVPATAIATARINQASFTYPLGQVTVDNTAPTIDLAFNDGDAIQFS